MIRKNSGLNKAKRKFSWTKLRENFRRCLNRQKKATMSGAGGYQLPSCQFFTELMFLKVVIGVKMTSSNIKCDIFATQSPVEHIAFENIDYTIKALSSRDNLTLTENETVVSSIASPQMIISSPNQMKRKMKPDPLQVALEKAIIIDVEQNKQMKINDNDPDELFCKSLVSSFQNLSKNKNKIAKIKVMEILLELEDDND